MYRSQLEDRHIVVLGFVGELVGVARDNGETRWTCTLPGAHGAVDFTIEKNRVYAASHPGKIYCVDYFSGKVIWEADAFERDDYDSKEHARPALIVDGECLFASGWRGELVCYSTEGERLWSREPMGAGHCSAPALGVPGNVRLADTVGKV